MEAFLAHCSTYLPADLPIVASVMLAGLMGSISHCSAMCSPIVTAQMMQLRTSHKPLSLMGYYHAGRIATYILLALVTTFASKWVFAGIIQPYTSVLLILAGVLFIVSAALPRKTHACCSSKTQTIQQWLNQLAWQRVGYFLRGALMGFMPCGMVYAVLIAVAAMSSYLQAAFVMFAFGLATLPALHIIGKAGLRLTKHYPQFSTPISRIVMAINGLFLCGIGMNGVSIS